MAWGLSHVRAACSLVFVVVAAIGCTSLPDTVGQSSKDCSFGTQPSQSACQTWVNAAQCKNGSWRSSDQSCAGTSCPALSNGIGGYGYCGTGSVIGASSSDVEFAAWTASGSDTSASAAVGRIGAGPSGDSASVAAALAIGQRFESTAAVTIDEFALPVAGMQPGPIVLWGQKMLFSAVATCTSTANCTNSGVFSVDTSGNVASVETFCGNGGDACRVTGLTPLSDGGYCYAATRIVTNFTLLPDTIYCTGTGYKVLHPVRPLNGFLSGVAAGYDGKIWYLDGQFSGIGRFTANDSTAALSTYLVNNSSNLGLAMLVAGPDQAMWFTATYSNQIGRINTSGYNLTTLPTADSRPAGIALGPDGNLWFTEWKGNQIGRITPAGVVTEFALPNANSGPMGIAAGPDGAIWFTEFDGNRIGRITTSGTITEYAVTTANAQPSTIVAGPDGNLWFTEFNANKIGRITPPPVQALPQVVEFYNVNLDNYFITANSDEQKAIDGGSAGPGWGRTGGVFASGGSTAVCRFYGSITPGPNSHFYTADANECAQLKQIQATTPATQKRWNFESNDFLTTPAANGACASGLVPIYRAYNNGFSRGIDSNHRITPSQAAIAEVVNRGWSSEGIVMCAPQ